MTYNKTSEKAVSKDWTPSANKADAFMDEARRMRKEEGIDEKYGNYNRINSPGEKMLKQKGG